MGRCAHGDCQLSGDAASLKLEMIGGYVMAVVVLLHIQFDESKADEYKAALQSMLPETRKHKGALKIHMLVDKDQPADVVVYEEWETRADHEAYIAWRTERGDMEKLGSMLRAAPSIKYYDVVDT
ncbi:MAG: antibiotic biosynthesis monooxygenase [Rhodospirillaceae bacterium]|nr:MAG: antibiotic biosynthesis monooxygenase [Rhodospirillaceae bacterium]